MADTAGHFSADELAAFEDEPRDGHRAREHLAACEMCRERRAEVVGLRALLAQTGQRERRPVRDGVPSAMMRLRLRRHSVANANELLEGFAAFVRAVASLFSLPTTDQQSVRRTHDAEGDRHE